MDELGSHQYAGGSRNSGWMSHEPACRGWQCSSKETTIGIQVLIPRAPKKSEQESIEVGESILEPQRAES